MRDSRVFVVTGHGCAFNLRGANGGLLRKTWRFVTNDPGLAEILSRKCPGESPWHVHEICQGKSTTNSQNYTVEMARSVLKRAQELVKSCGDVLRYLPDEKPSKHFWKVSCAHEQWEPAGLFNAPLENKVFFLDLVRDSVIWRRTLVAAERWLGTAADMSLWCMPAPGLPAC